MKNFFITTPIYYVNSKPHIGSVYTTIMADIVNRFKKLNKIKTYFLTGVDEHGLKIQQTAEKLGKTEQELVDEVAEIFKVAAKNLKIENDDFIRTTEKRHKIFVQEIWEILIKNDWIYRGKYTGWYCVSDEAYYSEDELVKDENGVFKTELGKIVEWKEEDSYFFRLSEFQEILLYLYQNNENFIQPTSRRNEILSFVGGSDLKSVLNGEYKKNYLKDLSISRNNFTWGIKISCDDKMKKLLNENKDWLPAINDEEKHVIYVWLDALFNYQSAVQNNLDEIWYNSDVVHFVGKDIIKFHTIYWPAFLLATKFHRDEFKTLDKNDLIYDNVLPKTVFAHGWWTNEGRKISKSFGNIIDPFEEIDWLVKTFNIENDVAVDYFKYYLATDGIFGSDLDYSRNRFVERINSELVNNIGNLVQRVLSMIYKNLDGKVEKIDFSKLNEIDLENVDSVKDLEWLLNNDTMNKFNITQYKDLIITMANVANDYMEKTTPWLLKKNNQIEEFEKTMNVQMFVIIKIITMLQVFCPYITKKVFDFLQINDRNFKNINENISLAINEPKGFFPRLENK